VRRAPVSRAPSASDRPTHVRPTHVRRRDDARSGPHRPASFDAGVHDAFDVPFRRGLRKFAGDEAGRRGPRVSIRSIGSLSSGIVVNKARGRRATHARTDDSLITGLSRSGGSSFPLPSSWETPSSGCTCSRSVPSGARPVAGGVLSAGPERPARPARPGSSRETVLPCPAGHSEHTRPVTAADVLARRTVSSCAAPASPYLCPRCAGTQVTGSIAVSQRRRFNQERWCSRPITFLPPTPANAPEEAAQFTLGRPAGRPSHVILLTAHGPSFV
jgi:hypothetical protein